MRGSADGAPRALSRTAFVIGGYQDGGDYEWASYSPVFGAATLSLYHLAEATA
jgi:hypothetical protein